MMHKRFSRYAALLGFLAFGAGMTMLLTMPSDARMPQSQKDRMESPARLSHGPEGLLLVTDYNTQEVLIMNKKTLKRVRSITVKGRPLGIAWARGRIYVGNESSGSVEVYNPAGKWMYTLGGTPGQIRQPSDIAVDEQLGRVFVVDGYENSVKVFDLEGAEMDSIGSSGAVKLVDPTGITLDAGREEVLISDYGDPALDIDAKIFIFGYAGNYLGEIAGDANTTVRFSRPQGLAVDSGNIFMVDGMLGQILVFDRESTVMVKTLGEFGTEPGQLQLPLDVVIDLPSGDVYVTNNRAQRVELFAEGGLVP